MNETLFKKLLDYYEIDEETYRLLNMDVNEQNFALGHHFDHIEEAVKLVNEVIKENGKIFIYGDYDADGIMGTSILVKMFRYVFYPVNSYIPNRYQDGYGLTLNKAKEFVENGANLVITVDNGVSCIEQIDYLKANNVKVLILDHHQIQEELPKADYILHPTFSNFGTTASSGAFVAFMFSIAFLGRFDKYLSTLASISLISDMMPLKEYNRNLLRLVIENFKENEFIQIDSLKEGEPFDENTIGMKIAPKINAVGRMIDSNEINKLVDFFTLEDNGKSLTYLKWIYDTNETRKRVSKETVDELEGFDENLPAIVYVSKIKEGLLGLVANHLMNKYKKPAIVLCLDTSGECYKGSCRAPEGFNIVECFTSLNGFLEAFGGHAAAGGCSVNVNKINEFKEAFIEYARNKKIVKEEKKTIDLGITDLTFDTYELVNTFSPFGESWEKPLFKIKKIDTNNLFFSKTGEHLITQIGMNSKLTGFNMPRDEVKQNRYIDIIGTLKISSYKGKSSVEFFIEDYNKSNM